MDNLGLKELTPDNYLQIDEIMGAFVAAKGEGGVKPVSPCEWASEILAVRLTADVPLEVRRLFAVARGTMLYGYYFYPLYALATEQLLRVAEAGLSERCHELGAPAAVNNFSRRIVWLRSQRILSDEEAGLWHALRGLRNSASHPADQLILPPGSALGVLKRIAEHVSGLYRK